jgi:hypothetical protein
MGLTFSKKGDSIREVKETMAGILWAIVVILVVLWLIGFVALHVSSGLIHLLLIVALIVLLYNLFVGSRARRL